MRPTRKQIKFDEDSLNQLYQEIYDDSHNIKAKIVRLFTKWETRVKEGGEIAALGDQIVKLIAAEAKNQDQKIMLLKYLKDIVYEKSGKKDVDTPQETGEVTSDARNTILRMIKEEEARKKQENR